MNRISIAEISRLSHVCISEHLKTQASAHQHRYRAGTSQAANNAHQHSVHFVLVHLLQDVRYDVG